MSICSYSVNLYHYDDSSVAKDVINVIFFCAFSEFLVSPLCLQRGPNETSKSQACQHFPALSVKPEQGIIC